LEKTKIKMDMLRNIGKQFEESVELVLRDQYYADFVVAFK